MGTKLGVSTTGTLYDYWGSTISETLLADLTNQTIEDELSLKKEINKKRKETLKIILIFITKKPY